MGHLEPGRSLLAQQLSAQDYLRRGRRLVLLPVLTLCFHTQEGPRIPGKDVFPTADTQTHMRVQAGGGDSNLRMWGQQREFGRR